ncbi:MAG: hypothetical protein ACI9F9_000379 [Candidatus Paceibacteria bacterium]|jgi:hypothetical protein
MNYNKETTVKVRIDCQRGQRVRTSGSDAGQTHLLSLRSSSKSANCLSLKVQEIARRRCRRIRRAAFGILFVGFAGAANSMPPAIQLDGTSEPSLSGYFNYIGNYPDEADNFLSTNIQGIGHSDDHWFISRQHGLYKIAVSEPLSNPSLAVPFVPIASLHPYGYQDFKALDTFEVSGPLGSQWYVLCGIQGGDDGAALGIFDSDLQLVAIGRLPAQSAVGWCAVRENGEVYTGENHDGFLRRYAPSDWLPNLGAPGSPNLFDFPLLPEHIPLIDAAGNDLFAFHLQGGDFAPDQDVLFLSSGYYGISSMPHGIHKFNLVTLPDGNEQFVRERKSIQSGLFRFQYGNPTGTFYGEEPQGLTFWDLNDGRAPGILGELHVLLLDNDAFGDDFYLKHYTRGLFVDGSHSGAQEGNPGKPWTTVNQAIEALNDGWDFNASGVVHSHQGMILQVQPGTYTYSQSAILFIDESLLITAPNGGVVVN